MNSKKWVTGTVALSMSLVTAACTQTAGSTKAGSTAGSQTNGNLTVARALDAIDLSPDGSFLRSTDSQIVTLIADGLYRINKDDQVEPAIAAAIPKVSDDQLSWTIALKPGTKFSNGASITSADVKFSLDNAKKGNQQGKLFQSIASIDTPDAQTVVIHTATKDATLLWKLATVPAVILPNNFNGVPEKTFYQQPVGAGAFMIAERKPSVDLKLVRNPSYYGTKANLASITFLPVKDPNTRVLRLRAGNVDMIEDPPTQQVAQLRNGSSFQIVSLPVGAMRLGLNTTKAPLNDLHVRRAISLALDRTSMVKAALGGNGTIACSWISPTVLRGHKPAFGCTTNLAEANNEMAKSAHAQGATFTLVYDSADSQMPLTAQIIQSDLAKINIKVELDGTTNQLYKAALANKTFQGRFSLFATPGDPGLSVSNYIATDAESTSSPMLSVITGEYAQAAATFDETARFAIYYTIMDQIAENGDAIGLYNPNKLWASTTKVTGAAVLPTNKLNFTDISISK